MTLTQKRKQLIALFGAYSIQLEKLYDKFLYRLAKLAKSSGVSVEDLLKKDALYSFDNYPELREQLQEIMRNFFKEGILAIRSGIASGVALSFKHNNADLKSYSVLSEMALHQVRDNAATAFYERRIKPEQGLSLSSIVWNYVRQAKSEVEAGISCVMTDGLMKGTSAEELARKVKVYLNEPDMMWRRYHEKVFVNGQKKDVAYWRKKVVDENGKVHFIKTDPYHPGQGVYKSSRKNALRLARTEINGSYHYANHQRWKQEPFVIGIRIWMSPQHPEEDICDELAGDYPKDFFFSGWHPQCMCAAMPLTIQGKEKEDFYKRLAKGEDMSNYVSPNAVKDVPKAYKDYIKRDKEAIMSAAERGKMAWHLYDNQKYWVGEFTAAELKEMGLEPIKPAEPKKRIKTEEEKADIQRRWDERKERNRILDKGRLLLTTLRDYPKIKSGALEDAIKRGRAADVVSISKNLQKELDFERTITPISLLDSVMRERYGDEAVDALYKNAERTIRDKVNIKSSIEDKIEALRYEAKWIVENRSFATKHEVAAYYEREAKRLEAMRDFDLVKADIEIAESRLSKYGVKSVLTGEEGYLDIDEMRKSLKSLDKYKEKIERVEKLEKYAKTSKSPDIRAWDEGVRYDLRLNGIDASVDELLDKAEERIKRIEYDKAYAERKKKEKEAEEYRKKMEKLLGKTITVNDLKAALGENLPKTLVNLQKKIDSYVKGQGISEENRMKIISKIREVFANSDLGMNVPRLDRQGNEVLDKLLTSHFKNQVETGTGNGCVDVNYRMEASKELFGTDTKTATPKEYEKYGFLMDKDILKQAESGIADGYWNCGDGFQIRFKRDKVIATFTMMDSLGSGRIPSLVTDPQTSSFGYSMNSMIKDDSVDRTSAVESTRAYASSYIELQYHGDLTLDCIESIYIPDGVLPKLSEASLKALVDAVKKYGFTLYSNKGGKLMRYEVVNGALTPI